MAGPHFISRNKQTKLKKKVILVYVPYITFSQRGKGWTDDFTASNIVLEAFLLVNNHKK